MPALATAFVRILSDKKGLKPGVVAGAQEAGGAGGKAAATGFRGSFIGGLKGIAGPLAAIFGAQAIAGFFKGAVTGASDLQESVNAVQVTFGEAAKGILDLSKGAATGLGLSKSEFNSLAVQFSSFAGTIAGEGGNVVGTMDELTTRAADFASVMNLDVAEAARLFQSGLAGETEPLRKFGIDLSAAAVKAHAYEAGIADVGSELSEQQKVQARYSLLLAQTSKVQGDFANTSGSLANQQRILGARFDNFKATLGQALLPVITRIVTFMNQSFLPALKTLFRFMGENKEVIAAVGIAIAAVLVPAFVAWAVSAGAAAIATIAAAAPIIAIGAVIAALAFLVIKNWDTIKRATVAVWNAVTGFLRKNWQIILAVIAGPIGIIVGLVIKNWDTIKRTTSSVWNAVRSVISGVVNAVRSAVSGAWNTVRAVTSSAWAAVRNLVASAWSRIRSAVSTGISSVVSFMRGVPGRILGAVGNLGRLLFNAGRDVLRGLIDGIKSFVGNAARAAKDAVSSVVSGVTGFLGISSPSKLFADIGRQIPAGMAVGIQSGLPDLDRVMGDLGFRTQRAGLAPAGVQTQNVNVNLTAFSDQFRLSQVMDDLAFRGAT